MYDIQIYRDQCLTTTGKYDLSMNRRIDRSVQKETFDALINDIACPHETRVSVVRGSIFWWKRASNFFHIGNVGVYICEVRAEKSNGSKRYVVKRSLSKRDFNFYLV